MRDVARARGSAGLVVASTFSGGGGSCLGYEMAGYRVAWACELNAEARATFTANHPGTVIDARSVREVKGAELLAACGLKRGELDVLDGSPPCTVFSSAGDREDKWGMQVEHEGITQRVDDLFFEYTRLVSEVQPRAFVAENVAGMVQGKAWGYFVDVSRALRSAGYRVATRMLDAQWLGVPQSRQRVIFVGVREDLELEPPFPSPLPYRYSILDALPYLELGKEDHPDAPTPEELAEVQVGDHLQFILPREPSTGEGRIYIRGGFPARAGRTFSLHEPALTIMGQGMGGVAKDQVCVELPRRSLSEPLRLRFFTSREAARLCSFPADFELTGARAARWMRVGNAVPPRMMYAIARELRERVFRPAGRVSPELVEAP